MWLVLAATFATCLSFPTQHPLVEGQVSNSTAVDHVTTTVINLEGKLF